MGTDNSRLDACAVCRGCARRPDCAWKLPNFNGCNAAPRHRQPAALPVHQNSSAAIGPQTPPRQMPGPEKESNAFAHYFDLADFRIRLWRLSRGPRVGLLWRRQRQPDSHYHTHFAVVASYMKDSPQGRGSSTLRELGLMQKGRANQRTPLLHVPDPSLKHARHIAFLGRFFFGAALLQHYWRKRDHRAVGVCQRLVDYTVARYGRECRGALRA